MVYNIFAMKLKDKSMYIEENSAILFSTKSFFTPRTTKGVLSYESAASWWGFSEEIDSEWNITVPRNYNPTNKSKQYSFNRMAISKYELEIITFKLEDREVRVYSPERTIIEIVKRAKKSITDVIIQTIRNFFTNFKYSSDKLHQLAKEFNVDQEVTIWEMALNG